MGVVFANSGKMDMPEVQWGCVKGAFTDPGINKEGDIETYRIAVIGGDGIGPEVLAEGIKVLKTVEELDGGTRFAFEHFPWGCEHYLKHGRAMDDDGMERLAKFDAIYLGAVGSPSVPDHISLWDLLWDSEGIRPVRDPPAGEALKGGSLSLAT
jgi:hypothetical protein